MKKIFLAITLCCIAFADIQAQNLISKVPTAATAVIKYGSDNFTKKVPLQKIDTYFFIKKNLNKILGLDSLASIQNTGINVEQDAYQYVYTADTCLNFVTLINLKNTAQFLAIIEDRYKLKIENKKVQKTGYDFVTLSDDLFLGVNNTQAVFVSSSYQNKKYYTYSYGAYDSAVTIVDTTFDETVAVMPPTKATPKKVPPVIKKDGYKVPKKPLAKKGKTPVKPTPKNKKPIIEDDQLVEEIMEDVVTYDKDKYAVQDSIEAMKRELFTQQQDLIAKKQQQIAAENIINNSFVGSINSIQNDANYKKIVDQNAAVSVWFDYEDVLSQFQKFTLGSGGYGGLGSMGRTYPSLSMLGLPSTKNSDINDGVKNALNIYFDADKLRMEQKSFTTDPAMNTMSKNIMNSKQNEGLASLVNPGNIGYLSVSVNNEALVNYYYSYIKKYLRKTPYMGDYADMVDVYIDLLEIVIDEKGIADLNTGNYLFVLHDMTTKMVDYTDYTYDSEYNKTEVKKTKKELVPNFTFALETRNEAFMQKLAKLPLKYNKKFDFNYTDNNGFYELVIDSGKGQIGNIYFIVKNGKVIITTSKLVVDNTLAGKGFDVDGATKKSILNNNYSANLNSKKLFQILETEASTKVNKDICKYMQQNLGDIKSESNYSNGMVLGSTTMAITGNHSNSLEFLFNTIEEVFNITEKDKVEKAKRED